MESESKESKDPLDWTVDQVVSFLCYNTATPWSQSANPPPLPDPAKLELLIRENLINGEVLLNDVDRDTLRDDLGVKALGNRSSVLNAIRYLRRISAKYQQANSSAKTIESYSTFSPAVISDHVLLPSLGPQSYGGTRHLAEPSPYSSPAVSKTSPVLPDISNVDGDPPTPKTIPFPPESTPTPRVPTGTSPEVGALVRGKTGQNLSNAPPLEYTGVVEEAAPRLRGNEHIHVDSQGRKRRKLDISSGDGQLMIGHTAPLAPHLSGGKRWYMGPQKMDPEDLFYPIMPEFQPLESSFTIFAPQFPKAQRQFAKRCLHQFFRQQPVDLGIENGSYNQAIVPCKFLISDKGLPRSFTLFSSKGGRVSVTHENSDKWDEFNDENANPKRTSKDPYDVLLAKYPVTEHDDNLLPVFGESGSEGEYDSDTMREIEEERLDPVRSTYLKPQEVETTIENVVTEFRKRWMERQLPKQQRKARRIWLQARTKRDTYQRIKGILHDIQYLERRLKKLRGDISLNDYTKEAELRLQCQSMEQTVYNIESQKWQITVLEQERCPQKLSLPSRSLPKKRPHNIEEESLDSESEVMSDESIADFIVHDIEEDTSRNLAGPTEAILNNFVFSENDSSGTSSDSDDIISPSGRRSKQRQRREPLKLPVPRVEIVTKRSGNSSQLPKFVRYGEQDVECVDLTGHNVDSLCDEPLSDELEIATPPLNPEKHPFRENDHTLHEFKLDESPGPLPLQRSYGSAKRKIMSHPRRFTPRQGSPSIPDASTAPWHVLEERRDAHGILARLVAAMPDEELRAMEFAVKDWSNSILEANMKRGLRSLLGSKKKALNAFLDSEVKVILRVCSLYVSWINARRFEQSKGIERSCVEKALGNLATRSARFGEILRGLLLNDRKGSLPPQSHLLPHAQQASPSQERQEIEVRSSVSHTPHKKRKREVRERQEVRVNHDLARDRMRLQEEQRKTVEQRLESLGVSNDDPARQAISFNNPIVYLDPHIGGRVKPHQLEGIRFMWRELIQNDKKEDDKREGCLLAHTMGLGKTMQVISLLVTIAATAASSSQSMRSQVPVTFHRSQSLIICPPSLIENWYEEFCMWTPRKNYLGPIRKVTSSDTLAERLNEVSSWSRDGGVLILSYDLFRAWVHNKENLRRTKPLSEEVHARVREQLLNGPNIVIADEAHRLNNPAALISAATKEFRTKSRIALTGSPLVNNLENYFAMIDWIAPGYLGSFIEFKANYVEPIVEGSYVDSTYYERRKSLKKRQVLLDIIGPKVHRADISVLEGDLPPKVEFVIKIPLTELQEKLYNQYVESVTTGDTGANAQIWSYCTMLSLCCHHPACFLDGVTGAANNSQKAHKKGYDADTDETPVEEPSSTNATISEALITKQKEIFATVPNFRSLQHSYRMQMLIEIIRESLRVGDKVLVFSQRILTLDYIESFLKDSGIGYRRLDGSTPMVTRQAVTKSFNRPENADNVYLISTRAGGLGLNIPGANRVVIFDFSFSPMWEEQAVGRAYRIGQQKEVFVYRFIAGGTFEETIHNKAVFKAELASRVVDRRNPVRSAVKNKKEYLFPVKLVPPADDLSEYMEKDPHVLDKIIKGECGQFIRDITLSETFHRDDNDKLTEEEKKDVQEELNDEWLKRSNPKAYELKMQERQRTALKPPMTSGPYPDDASDFRPIPFPLHPILSVASGPSEHAWRYYQHPQSQTFDQPDLASSRHVHVPPSQVFHSNIDYRRLSNATRPERPLSNQLAVDLPLPSVESTGAHLSTLTLLTGIMQDRMSEATISQQGNMDHPLGQGQPEAHPTNVENDALEAESAAPNISAEAATQAYTTMVTFPQTDGAANDHDHPIEISD